MLKVVTSVEASASPERGQTASIAAIDTARAPVQDIEALRREIANSSTVHSNLDRSKAETSPAPRYNFKYPCTEKAYYAYRGSLASAAVSDLEGILRKSTNIWQADLVVSELMNRGSPEGRETLRKIHDDTAVASSIRALAYRIGSNSETSQEELTQKMMNPPAGTPPELIASWIKESSEAAEEAVRQGANFMDPSQPAAVRLAGISLEVYEDIEIPLRTLDAIFEELEEREFSLFERQLLIHATCRCLGVLAIHPETSADEARISSTLIERIVKDPRFSDCDLSSLMYHIKVPQSGTDAGVEWIRMLALDLEAPFHMRERALQTVASHKISLTPEQVELLRSPSYLDSSTRPSIAVIFSEYDHDYCRSLVEAIMQQPDAKTRAYDLFRSADAIETLGLREILPQVVETLRDPGVAKDLFFSELVAEIVVKLAREKDHEMITSLIRDDSLSPDATMILGSYFAAHPELTGNNLPLIIEAASRCRLPRGYLGELVTNAASRADLPLLFDLMRDTERPLLVREQIAGIFEAYKYEPALQYFRTVIHEPNHPLTARAWRALARQGNEADLTQVAQQLKEREAEPSHRDDLLVSLSHNMNEGARRLFVERVKALTPPGPETKPGYTRSDEERTRLSFHLSEVTERFIGWKDEHSEDLRTHLLDTRQHVSSNLLVWRWVLRDQSASEVKLMADYTAQGVGAACAAAGEDMPGYINLLMRNPDGKVKQYGARLQSALDQGLAYPLRFNLTDIPRIISDRTYFNEIEQGLRSSPSHDSKVALVVFPTSDWNGAFNSQRDEIHKLISLGYRIRYLEAETEQDLVSALQSMSAMGGADLMIFAGHGSQKEFSLGGHDPAHSSDRADRSISLSDEALLVDSHVTGALKDGGRIIMVSCSVGQGLSQEDNIVNMMRRVFPHAEKGGIFGPSQPTNVAEFREDSDGRVEPVYLDGNPQYRADASTRLNGISSRQLT